MKISKIVKVAGWLFGVGLFILAGRAIAANITYSAATTITFSSPATNMTFANGVTLTNLIVNAGSMVVTIPTTTTFTLTSTTTDISYTGASTDATRSLTCSGGTATLTITTASTTAETVTISPSSAVCGSTTGGGGGGGSGSSGGGGGGGGGGASPSPSPTPTPSPSPGLSAPAGGAHANGTLVLSGSTVYLIKDGKRYGFRNPDEYKSHGYSFAQLVTATSGDLNLPAEGASIVKALEGTLVLDASDGKTVYMVGQGNTKRGFASEAVFKALGYSFANLPKINLSDYTSGSPITSGADTHPEGALVREKNGTVWWILAGKRQGFESMAVFNTYGFPTTRLVVANTSDLALPEGALVKFRDGTLVKDGSDYYLISDGKKLMFASSADLAAKGFKTSNAISASLKTYDGGGSVP